ncbi:MAG: 4Fe-4S binding protein [Firmicutes bacterium]|nr:4Fe-4S binding protein [Bacillota bacterium]
MEKIALMIFREDCCGCHACEVACKQEHGPGVGPGLIRVIEKSPDFIPLYCRHCAGAPCRKACPAGAIDRNEQGIVLIREERCTGCKACVDACPFGAMQFDGAKEVAVKCDLCFGRVRSGQAPACAAACPTRCIFFGDVKSLLERKAEIAVRG